MAAASGTLPTTQGSKVQALEIIARDQPSSLMLHYPPQLFNSPWVLGYMGEYPFHLNPTEWSSLVPAIPEGIQALS